MTQKHDDNACTRFINFLPKTHTHTHNHNKLLIKKLCCTTRFFHVALLRFKLIFMDEADSPIKSLSDGMHTKESGRLLIF